MKEPAAMTYSWFGEYRGDKQATCPICGEPVYGYVDRFSLFYDNPDHPGVRDVETYHGRCYDKIHGIDWSKVSCNVDEHHNLPGIPKEQLLYTGPGSMTPKQRAAVSIKGYGRIDLERREMRADKEPKPVKEDRSICYRCGDPAVVSTSVDKHKHAYCGVCAYIIAGFHANSYSVPIGKIVGEWEALMGICPECHQRVYAKDESYEGRIEGMWNQGMVFHGDCYLAWKERKSAESIPAKLEANNNLMLKPGQATLSSFIEV